MVIIPIIDTNPVIGQVQKDGTQQIGVYDSKTNGRRYIVTSQEKIDDFINSKNEKQKDDTKKAALLSAGTAILGGIAGKISLKDFGKFGIAWGAVTAATVGLFAGIANMLANEDKITQQFIQNNK